MLPLSQARAQTAQPLTADALFLEHQRYVNWSAGDGKVKYLRELGESVREGKRRSTFEHVQLNDAFLNSASVSDGFTTAIGFTGKLAWVSNQNGFTTPVTGETAKALLTQQALFCEIASVFTPQLGREHVMVDDHETTELHLHSNVALPADVYVDPATGAYRRIVIDPDGKYQRTFNGIDYTAVGDRRFLTTWHVGASTTVSTYTKVEVNVGVTAAEVHPPPQLATWSFGDEPAKIEFANEPAQRIFVDAVVNGVKGRFLLDTGAGGTSMLDSFARRAHAMPIGQTRAGGIGGSMTANTYEADTVQLGGSTLHHVHFYSGLSERWSSEGIVGLLGYDILAGTIADLNFDASTLRLYDPATQQADTSTGFVLHPDLSTAHIRIPMQIAGKYDVMATLDSGNPSEVLFSSYLVEHDGLPFRASFTGRGYGISGVGEVHRCGKLPSLSLGPITYQQPKACSSASFDRNEVLVGLEFMHAFNFVFDYPDDIVVMIPRRNY
jgi:hypothetical protein